MDYYIVGNCSDEKDYLRAAVKYDVEIIGTMTKVEDIFKSIPVSSEVEVIKRHFKFTVE